MTVHRPVRRPLPRGAHGLPREFVAHDQRERMLDAMADVVAERGYSEGTVADVLAAARVSRRTFYEHFRDREECFLAAYDAVARQLGERVAAAARGEPAWPARVRASFAAFLEFLSAEPAFASMLIVESLAAGPRALDRYGDLMRTFVPLLAEGRERAAGLPETLEEAIVSGVAGLVYRRTSEGRAAELGDLLPDLLYFALAPYVGHDAALAESRSS